ncbi:MAG: carbohydrate-binding domain-containing protein [Paludibacteraceae bacterium]|nr:carbohydrate-binding domain-containing protein [Paludibacteraceae bacterium]
MKKAIIRPIVISLLSIVLLPLSIHAQTLNVQVGNVLYQFPSAQTFAMPYDNGTTLTVMGKVFNLSEIDNMYVDETKVTDGSVKVAFSDASAAITVAGNVAKDLTITSSGAHVSIVQSADLASEVTYTLSGSSADGGFYTEGAYKATVELDNLQLTNVSATYSGAAIHVQNSKRIKVKPLNGTTNTLMDATGSNQKGCLYIQGHAEFAQNGTLNVTGNVKHGIKCGEYFQIKNSTINILAAAGDGINCEQFFLMESGTININNVADDGIQCDIEDTDTGSTGETAEHEDEDSGNMYLQGGTLNIAVTGIACKGIKAQGNIRISGGDIAVSTSGNGKWDTTELETKSASCINSDANVSITGGTIHLTSTGSGGKGLKCDSMLTISGSPVISIATTGGLYYNNGSTENLNYTGDTDRVDSKYYSSPKGIRAGTKTLVSGSGNYAVYSYAGGIVIDGGKITVSTTGNNGEGIESKDELVVNGGEIVVNSYDDAINSANDMTINGGLIYARATKNDGLDANGNVYIKGGIIYAIGSSTPEVAIDAKEGKTLSITGGTIVAVGNLETGAVITGGTCKQTSSYTANSWYALYNGDELVLAFKTPTRANSGGGPGGGSQKLVVYTASNPALKSGVTASGTEIFNGEAYYPATATGGTNVTLSNYSNSGGGPGGGGW